MLFNSMTFVIFFTIVYLLYLCFNHKWQNAMLLVASYIFYGSWDWRFLSLIIISTVVDYFCGIHISKAHSKGQKKKFLIISLITNLGLLGFFKYFNFFTDNFIAIAALFGWKPDLLTLRIILPVGISFYTFQTLSYTIDVYKGALNPERNFFRFALFVSFFPQLVAGPIERAKHLIPQINEKRHIGQYDIKLGLWLILWGYFLKSFVADNLGQIADSIFANSAAISGFEGFLGLYAFAFQIFGDFAGYSSIAIGIARLMGFRLMTNFRFPYFVTNPSDFWRHWHISLSSWLRDYLYIPLGGNRQGTAMLYRNLFLTMLLGGLWHGASWTFVLWGVYQGMILIIHRLISQGLSKSNVTFKPVHLIKVITMFQITCLGWLIFRAQTITQIGQFLKAFSRFDSALTVVPIPQLIVFLSVVSLLTVIMLVLNRFDDDHSMLRMPRLLKVIIVLTVFYALVFGGEFGTRQFIYFQF